MTRTVWVGGCITAAILLAGCVSPPVRHVRLKPYRPRPPELQTAAKAQPPVSPAAESPIAADQPREYGALKPLQIGDKLTVSLRFYPEPETLQTVVDESGSVNLPLINSIRIAGMTKSQAEKAIEKAYIEQGFYKAMTVVIVPPETEYYVRGEVRRPCAFPLTSDLTFLMALSQAGGFTEFADPTRVRVIRGQDVFYVNARKIEEGGEKDQVVRAGDVIVVLRSWH
jgi:polysaccharide export outer membrane protein